MMGLVAPINREEKKQKGSPLMTGSEALPPCDTRKHPKKKKKNKRRGAEAPAPLALCSQWPGIKLLHQTTPTCIKK
jgi:hypothetical protein